MTKTEKKKDLVPHQEQGSHRLLTQAKPQYLPEQALEHRHEKSISQEIDRQKSRATKTKLGQPKMDRPNCIKNQCFPDFLFAKVDGPG